MQILNLYNSIESRRNNILKTTSVKNSEMSEYDEQFNTVSFEFYRNSLPNLAFYTKYMPQTELKCFKYTKMINVMSVIFYV